MRNFKSPTPPKRRTVALSAREQMMALHEELKKKNTGEPTSEKKKQDLRMEREMRAIRSIQNMQQKVNNFEDPEEAELSELLFRIEHRKHLE